MFSYVSVLYFCYGFGSFFLSILLRYISILYEMLFLQAIHNLSIEICFLFLETTFFALTLYLYCYNGKRATDCFGAFSNCLYEFNWAVLPIHLQKDFILMIAHAQKPFFYHGCGLVEVNLETFLKVDLVIKRIIRYINSVFIFIFADN